MSRGGAVELARPTLIIENPIADARLFTPAGDHDTAITYRQDAGFLSCVVCGLLD
jgi:hypothetical protein